MKINKTTACGMTALLEHGFVSEPHKSCYGTNWLVSPATMIGGEVMCCDPSGFHGQWKMKEGGVFFQNSDPLSVVCHKAMQLAKKHAKKQNASKR